MSRWVELVRALREEHGLAVWASLPEALHAELAARCGPAELADVRERLARLDEELARLPEWDGDSRDDVWRARQLFLSVLRAHGEEP